tara:strand:+ start:104 stop:250 length:147 start_codon:yes stop_codon:yes gene_type:complete
MNPGVCKEWSLEQLERERNLNGLPLKQPLLQLETVAGQSATPTVAPIS